MRLDKGHFTALAAGVIWGTAGVPTRVLFDAGVTPLQASTYRAVAMTLVMTLLILFYDRKLFRVRKTDLLYITGLGLFGTALGYITYNSAMKYTTLAIASMLTYTNPIYTTVLAAVFFKERIYKGKLIGLVLLVSGCSVLAKIYDAAFFNLNTVGIVYGLLTGMCISLSALCAKKLSGNYHTLTMVFYTFSVGALFLVAFSFPWSVPAGIYDRGTVLSLVYLVLSPGLAGFLLYMYSIKRIEVSQTESCVTIEPAIAAMLGFLFCDEKLDLFQLLGAAVILIGVLVFNDAWGIERQKNRLMSPDQNQSRL